jgi:hypothetical protein
MLGGQIEMTISRTEAAEALSEIERTAGRTQELRGYRAAGPTMVLWGVIWIVGYVATGLLPADRWYLVWIPLDLIGFAVTFLLHRKGRGGETDARWWRSPATALAMIAFYAAVLTVFQPLAPNTYLAFPGLFVGALYGLMGIWRMTRYLWIGAAMFVLTLIGFFCFPMWLAFWMAALGGGLILGGLWMRKA